MKPHRWGMTGFAGLVLAITPTTATAAWDNVFQVTCCGSMTPRTSSSISFSVPVSPCCPQTCCPQTTFVQRSVVTPVTTYRPVIVQEPVTTYRTSFFYEPVTTTSFSLFIDPCTGCAQQVATPTTSFRLRQRCDPVTSFVQRVSYQPVTTQVQSFYLEPVTVNPCAPVVTAPAAAAQPAMTAPIAPAPTTTEQFSSPPNSQSPPLNLTTPNDENRSSPGNPLRNRMTSPAPTTPRPPIQWDQVASWRQGITQVEGTIVTPDFQARPAVRVRFVPIDNQSRQQEVLADGSGQFQVGLLAGRWRLYVDDARGAPEYHSQLEVSGSGSRTLTVVSR